MIRPGRGRWRWAAAGFLLSAVGCELAETAAPDSEDVLVVEAVLRADAARQFVLLHRSLDGPVVRGESGAAVDVLDASGRAIRFEETRSDACYSSSSPTWEGDDLVIAPACYASPEADLHFVKPGETYELRIETAGGEVVRGRTTVPAAYAFTSPAVPLDPVSFSASCLLPETPFTLAWNRSEGAWAYVITLFVEGWRDELPQDLDIDVEDPLTLTSVSVSAADTTLVFPLNVGLFQRGEIDQRLFELLRSGLPRLGEATLVVVATDRNYTNAIRGGRFNPSGNLRISSVVGDGVGVFGSVAPITIRSRPGAGADCPTPLPPPATP